MEVMRVRALAEGESHVGAEESYCQFNALVPVHPPWVHLKISCFLQEDPPDVGGADGGNAES